MRPEVVVQCNADAIDRPATVVKREFLVTKKDMGAQPRDQQRTVEARDQMVPQPKERKNKEYLKKKGRQPKQNTDGWEDDNSDSIFGCESNPQRHTW